MFDPGDQSIQKIISVGISRTIGCALIMSCMMLDKLTDRQNLYFNYFPRHLANLPKSGNIQHIFQKSLCFNLFPPPPQTWNSTLNILCRSIPSYSLLIIPTAQKRPAQTLVPASIQQKVRRPHSSDESRSTTQIHVYLPQCQLPFLTYSVPTATATDSQPDPHASRQF